MSAATATRSQLALQSYLDALLQEATFEDLEPLVETPPAPAPLKPVALAVAEVATPAPALETLPVDHGFDEFEAAVHQVSRSIRLDPAEVKWRSQRSQRPWLAGTVIEHMCALLDVAALAELIASGAVKRLHGDH
ncbi:hypothetical protein [Pseudomonas aeruginosa]|uniref:hypothetical protein n=1 Tax=Pseudomonas aeruginosa TaxID=287 RepID=UPI000FF1844A|nr:hypothetical protein [Pseudomonas aeruginosa]RPT74986.1 hypothetical protein IPC948_08250 [Pseudomonas aeruginosa]